MAPPIDRVLETCLYVDDMDASKRFYAEVLGLEPFLEEDRILVYAVAEASVLILFHRGGTLDPVRLPTGIIPPHDATGPAHFALAIPAVSLSDWREHLAARSVDIEGEVAWPMGGHSLYFRDLDRHLIELATPGIWPNY